MAEAPPLNGYNTPLYWLQPLKGCIAAINGGIAANSKWGVATIKGAYCSHLRGALQPSKGVLQPSKGVLQPFKGVLQPSPGVLQPILRGGFHPF